MRSRVTALAAAIVLTLGLSACGDDSDDAEGGTTPTTSSPSDSGTPEPSASTPSVTPADGRLFQMQTFDIRLLKGLDWGDDDDDDVVATSAFTDQGLLNVALISGRTTTDDFDLSARTSFDTKQRSTAPNLKRVADRTIDGQRAYVFTAETEGNDRFYMVGGLIDDYDWEIAFDYPADWPDAQQKIESMLASVTFHEPTR